jgi:hypothetical protein
LRAIALVRALQSHGSMRMGMLAVVAAMGCSATVDSSAVLWVSPSNVAMTVDLAVAAPTVALQVFLDDTDITAEAAFAIEGAQLGTVHAGQLISDGVTGGAATMTVSYARFTATVPMTATVVERRGPITDAFTTAQAVPVDASLTPGDGVVVPPNLGAFEFGFIAPAGDDAQQIHITAPYLDLLIAASGVATIALTPNEASAMTRTAHAVDVELATLQTAAPATSHIAIASYTIAELPARAVMIGALTTPTTPPALLRYDLATAQVTPMLTGPGGTCVGCHVAISADGSRIAAGMASAFGGPAGLLFDATQGTILATSDATPTTPWLAATFDPNGALVTTSVTGEMAMRDGTTGLMILPIALGELAMSPTISPDGSAIAYAEVDPADVIGNPVGDALHVRPWNAGAVGASTELVRDGGGVVMPRFSPDGRWISYGTSLDGTNERPTGSSAVRSDGSATVALTTDPLDGLATWASPVGTSGGEAMVWIAINSRRPVPGLPAGTGQLWLEVFYPDRGAVSPAFHLPGQGTLSMLHGPLALP